MTAAQRRLDNPFFSGKLGCSYDASLARYIRIVEVTGSNPVCSTNTYRTRSIDRVLLNLLNAKGLDLEDRVLL